MAFVWKGQGKNTKQTVRIAAPVEVSKYEWCPKPQPSVRVTYVI